MNKDGEFVIDISDMERVAGQRGSNFAGIYQAIDGLRYYVKQLESPALARNEWLAAHLYQLAGSPTLNYFPSSDPCQVVTLWEALDKQNLNHFSANERIQAQQWFAVHAWTANWDALGMHGDNQGIRIGGQVLTIDLGGALQFRACGDPKGKAFGCDVDELTTLRTRQDNPVAVALFGQMDEAQMKDALARVSGLNDDDILHVVRQNHGSEKLAEKMVARKQFITGYLASL